MYLHTYENVFKIPIKNNIKMTQLFEIFLNDKINLYIGTQKLRP